jgi:hypothetical protein
VTTTRAEIVDNTANKLAEATQQIELLKRVLFDLAEAAARDIGIPLSECVAGPVGRARELLAGVVPDLGKPMGMVPIGAGRPPFGKGQRVIVYTEGMDFAGQKYIDIKADDLWVADPKNMSRVAVAATHWMYLPHTGA